MGKRLLWGAGGSVGGVALVEALVLAGITPLTPVAWPALGAIAASGVAGLPALVSGTSVVVAYYAANLFAPHRFGEFYANPANTVTWTLGLALLGLLTVMLRRRLDAQRGVLDSSRRLALALEGSGTAIWDTNLATRECVLSAAWSEMLGGPAVETRTTLRQLLGIIHPDDVQAALAASMETVKGRSPVYAHEHRVRTFDGRWIWILSRGRVTERDPRTGRALRMVGTNLEITSRKSAEERMQDLASHDALTGLANRPLLFERMARALARARRTDDRPALLYLDLDRFKEINDRLGHGAGDAVLREFAARLIACVREVDTVARVGGDEFVVLLENVRDAAAARGVAEKMVAAVRAPASADGRSVALTTSIGIALHNRPESADEWMKRADEALYEAKAAGRDTVKLAA